MNFIEYQDFAKRTAIYNNPGTIPGLAYTALGLAGEAGEVANKVKKVYRDGASIWPIAEELGDVLWYLAAVCTELNMSLEDIAASNIAKLNVRHS